VTDFPSTESADAPAPALVFQTEGADVAPEAYVGDAAADDVAAAETVVDEIAVDEAGVAEVEAEVTIAEVEAEVVAEEIAEVEDEEDPVEAFREQMRMSAGEWFVIHSYAGYENRVKSNLETRITSLNMEDYIFQVEVPMEEVTEIKQGQRKLVRRTKFPGYVLVRMDLTDESWGAVRHTPGVTGFVGHGHQPSPLSLD
jgi:transcription termination/antitermination protein NusG